MPREITSFSNDTVKLLRSLRDKKARREEGLFLAEGLRILTEARDSGRLPEIIAYSDKAPLHPLVSEIIAATEAAGGDVIVTSSDILERMSGLVWIASPPAASHSAVIQAASGWTLSPAL